MFSTLYTDRVPETEIT